MNIQVHQAHFTDYILLADLGRITFYETWRPVNTEEDMQNYMKDAFDPGKIKSDLEASAINTFLLAFDDKQAVGYAKIRRDRTYDEFKNEKVLEIERIYVTKEYQDKKVGKALMDCCIEIAREGKYLWLWLGVNIDNTKAINFYKKYGFEIFGEKNFKLGDAVDTDYLMKKKIT
jgi:ribosomal protein S18 acetylase RimI-like enzyme